MIFFGWFLPYCKELTTGPAVAICWCLNLIWEFEHGKITDSEALRSLVDTVRSR